MSVFVLSPAEFGAIAATLHTARDSLRNPLFPLSAEQELDFFVLHQHRSDDREAEYRDSLIDPFVYRLYLANVMAEQYTYSKQDQKQFSLPLIDIPKCSPVGLRELLKILRSLSYNIVTNGGNTFLGIKDDKKLRDVITAVKTTLVDRSLAA